MIEIAPCERFDGLTCNCCDAYTDESLTYRNANSLIPQKELLRFNFSVHNHGMTVRLCKQCRAILRSLLNECD